MADLDTKREYHLKCRVEAIQKSFIDYDKVQRTEECVILIPDSEVTETQRFFIAWLPDSEKEYYELPLFILHPVNAPCRGAIIRDHINGKHHIFVMSSGVEDTLRHRIGTTVNLTVLSEEDDIICDRAPTLEKSVPEAFRHV